MIKQLINNRLTIIIPFYGNCRYRKRNLFSLLNDLSGKNIKTIVAEQVTVNTHLNLPDNVTHIQFKHSNKTFNKGWLLNSAVNFVDTEYIWFCDADIHVNISKLLDKLVLDTNCIQPFEYATCLNDIETMSILQNHHGEQVFKNNKKINMYGALSFIIKKELYLHVGGICEEYNGWGYEDYDFYNKITKSQQIKIIRSLHAYHLWHPESQDKQTTGEANYKKFKQRGNDLNHIHNHIVNTNYKNWTFAKVSD